MTRAELVTAAGAAIRHGSKSFYMASRLFDRPTRERVWLLYSWCRHCDDVCDGQLLGGERVQPQGSVARLQELTERTLAGERTGEMPFDGLGALLRDCAVPHRYVHDHLSGFALDAEGWRPTNEAELIDYCYRVAGSVGCMMAVVMGVDPGDEQTLERASDLGKAFQLANIVRDVREDRDAGRCYLPQDLLAAHGLDAFDPLRPDQRDKLVAIVERLVRLADAHERSARSGIASLPFRSRWAVLSAGRIYGGIGRRVAALGPAAWDRRVVVRRRRKLAYLIPSLFESAAGRQGR